MLTKIVKDRSSPQVMTDPHHTNNRSLTECLKVDQKVNLKGLYTLLLHDDNAHFTGQGTTRKIQGLSKHETVLRRLRR